MTRNKKIMVLSGVVLMLVLLAAACIPGELQDSIRATQSDVQALKANVDKINKQVEALDKYARDPEITMSERDIKEHVVRGRADFIAFEANFNKLNKSASTSLTSLVGTPAKKDAKTGTSVPAKPGLVQTVDTKLDRLLGTPGKPATPAGEDPKTGKPIAAKPAIPAKPGLIDEVNAKLEKLVGTESKPAIAAKLDKKTGKVVTPAKPAIPAKPGAIDDIRKDIADIKAFIAGMASAIEQAAKPAPSTPATPPSSAPMPKP